MLARLQSLSNASRRPSTGEDPSSWPSVQEQIQDMSPDEACPVNGTMFQGFEWYVPADHQHWKRLESIMPKLQAIGIDKIWIPPGCKGGWRDSNGYDVYDLYDIGEFDWKGSRATKWGTKEEVVEMAKAADGCGIGILWDAVLNHRAAADYTESCQAVKVDPKGI